MHAKAHCARKAPGAQSRILPGTEIVKQRRSAADGGPHHHTMCMPPSITTSLHSCLDTPIAHVLKLQPDSARTSHTQSPVKEFCYYTAVRHSKPSTTDIVICTEHAWAPGVNQTHMLCLSWLAALRRSNHLSTCPSCAPNGTSAASWSHMKSRFTPDIAPLPAPRTRAATLTRILQALKLFPRPQLPCFQCCGRYAKSKRMALHAPMPQNSELQMQSPTLQPPDPACAP